VVGLDDTGIKRSGKKVKTAYWQRDPLSPPFHTNLMWGQRFLQASFLAPLYHFDGESSPRGLPIRFAEVTPVRKPGKNATTEQKAAYRQAKKMRMVRSKGWRKVRLCFPDQSPGPRYYGQELFSPEKVYHDPAIPWKETKIFHGSRFRRIRFKEVGQVLWQRGGGRRLLRLFVLAPTPYRKTKEGRCYYRQKAYLLCDDNQLAAKELLQAYFDR
jgi:hypothetical protein